MLLPLRGKASRPRDCHSAAPPSPSSTRFDSNGEGVSAKQQLSHPAARRGLRGVGQHLGAARRAVAGRGVHSRAGRELCNSARTPASSLLKRLLKGKGGAAEQ